VKKIFVDAPVLPTALEQLRETPGLEVRVADPIAANEELARPMDQIRDVHICLCSGLPRNLADMRQLELVQLTSSGFSQLFGLNLPAKGVRACNARGVFDTAIAEWNMAMMIALARDFRQMIRNQELRTWDRAVRFQSEIGGKTVGFWGYGGIARETARLCQTLGMKVHVLAHSGIGRRDNIYRAPEIADTDGIEPDYVFTSAQRNDFLRGLDFFILSMPLTKSTIGIIGEEELR
jgi:phosphoglycerate dehydrogenase-like enzyme